VAGKLLAALGFTELVKKYTTYTAYRKIFCVYIREKFTARLKLWDCVISSHSCNEMSSVNTLQLCNGSRTIDQSFVLVYLAYSVSTDNI
jgi:hypothetical protein